MSVLDRPSLEQSPLADLHAIASELGLDGYRRLRKADLIEALLRHQSGEPAVEAPAEPEGEEEREEAEPAAARRRRGRRGGRGRASAPEEADQEEAEAEEPAAAVPVRAARERAAGRRTEDRRAQDRRDEDRRDEDRRDERRREEAAEVRAGEDEPVEGVVELLPNGSGFLRVSPPEPSDDDVYISAAQVKRCELVSGDRVSGPRRAPRRSERFPSLVRVDTINGKPSNEVTQGARFDDLPAEFPHERLRLGSEDETVKAIEWLTPFGKGSRVSIAGAARSGKTEALMRLANSLAEHEGLKVLLALTGVRPEEIGEWRKLAEPVVAVSFAASIESQAHAVEQAVDNARRLVARGADVVLLIDTLDGLSPGTARRALAAARKIVDGGSLTVIATTEEPLGGETTVIALDHRLTSTGRFPALDLAISGTIRPELLVGEAGAAAISRARPEAI